MPAAATTDGTDESWRKEFQCFFLFGKPLKAILSLNNTTRLLGWKSSSWRRKKGHFENSHHNRVTQIPVNVCSNMLISVYRWTSSLSATLIPSDWPGQETRVMQSCNMRENICLLKSGWHTIGKWVIWWDWFTTTAHSHRSPSAQADF